MKHVALLALALAAHWMLLSGHTEPLLLAFGILSVAFVIFLARRMYTVNVESHPFELLPVVINVPARQKTDIGLVIHANSITLTPGTVSLRLGEGEIEVHALHPDVAKGTLDSGMDERVPE